MPLPSILAALILFSVTAAATEKPALGEAVRDDGLREAGWLQSIRLEPHRVRITAKLDTGAKSSAIHAAELERFERNGVERVRFSLYKDHTEQDGPKLTYDLPIEDRVRIKHRDGSALEERVTVRLSFCIDGELMEAEFGLDDRTHFNYPVLLGRDFLRKRFVIDPARTFVFRYDCPSGQNAD
ncbi:ATP-dependent zinc protease [Halochromatium glycolicum]|uniref:Retropepsin-like aspartic endopeptidase domain-containing protein n=1 Tax=Halochromatium glycolicum TaxID=85075 RepID=A0AAJ0U4S5_9GAMM|nr:RimK/LysX family protein [Halochromatium glycolicum]MBK1705269.1 hypothetical protein [Halochromatium glycolicum]